MTLLKWNIQPEHVTGMGDAHDMHTELMWQQVLQTALEEDASRHADHLWTDGKWAGTACGSFPVLDFDIGGFRSPRHCYSVMVFFMEQWHMAWTRRPDIVLSCVSANFLISSESCELGKIFNGRWSKKRYAKNYTVWSFIICTAHRTLLAKTMEDEKKGKWKICGRREHKFFCSGKHEGRRQLWKN